LNYHNHPIREGDLMQSLSTVKTKFSTLILIVGLLSGNILALLLWLDISPQLYRALAWICFGILALLSLVFLRRTSRRSVILLTVLASTSIIYLFPQLFGPACNGMPIAFAGHPGCTRECDEDCYMWDPEGQCSASKTYCWWECPEPDPDQPPSVSGIVACDQWGTGGWCRSNARLSLSASDPQGYAVSISGTAGSAFSCGASCTLNLPPGVGTAAYTVTSATSGMTASGATAWHYDPQPPTLNTTLSGANGSNGWYVSNVNVIPNASDAISGLASSVIAVDGSAAVGSAILTDGVHSVTGTAFDAASNMSSNTLTISVDTIAPTIYLSAAGNQIQGGWFSTPVDLSATASDATSGVMGSVSLSFDNGATWVNGPVTLNDGLYDALFHAVDRAGNIATSQMSLKIDTQPPTIALSEAGTLGGNGWYVSPATVSVDVSDNLSGVTSIQVRLDGGAWQDGASVTVDEGIHTIDFQSSDAAGNVQTVSQEIRVDVTPPAYNFDASVSGSVLSGTANLGGTVSDGTSGVHDVQFSSDGTTWLSASFAGAQWNVDWDSSVFDNGEHELFLRADDVAGNKGLPISVRIILDNDPPYVKLAETWNVWESGSLVIRNNIIPLKSVKITVHDPLQRYPDEVIFYALPAPTTVVWDRVIGPGSAPPGSYTVSVEVCDIYGLCSKDTGTIVIPAEPTPVPFQMPVIEIPEWIPPIPFFAQPPAPSPEQPIVVPASVPTHVDTKVIPLSNWSTVIIGVFLLSFALLLLIDPRPAALRSLTRSLHQHIQYFKE
jgi:hypothetical protein